jgi:hypothetical protein
MTQLKDLEVVRYIWLKIPSSLFSKTDLRDAASPLGREAIKRRIPIGFLSFPPDLGLTIGCLRLSTTFAKLAA